MTYKIDHIPRNTPNNRRPGLAMNPTTLTIHNTGNPASSAANERSWLTSSGNKRTASYHIVVDEHQTIEVLPLNEAAWHAGDGSGVYSGNRTSIGIEICESGDYAKTVSRAVELVAKMLKERDWGVDRLRRHYDWSKKICPRRMYDGGSWAGWTEFVERVKKAMKPTGKTPFVDVEFGRWSEGAIKAAEDAGLMNGYPDGTFRPTAPVTREELAVILTRLK